MADLWTTEAVLALAPTPNAAAAARKLAAGPWIETGHSRRALWALCKGSGRAPYQVIVDLEGPAWRCGCPSRQSPCKHALALLLLWADDPGRVPDARQLEMVDEWLADRDRRNVKAARRADAGPPDAEAQAKRAAERHARIDDGMAELDRWLGDLVRQGLARAREQPDAYWDGIAARMVDAQAPSVADRLRAVPDRIGAGDDWPRQLLAELGALHLITAGWSRLDTLPPATRADLRTAVGWHHSADDVAAGERVGDRWVVLAQSGGLAGHVHAYRTWLAGAATGRYALLVGFTPVSPNGVVQGAPPDHATWPAFHEFGAELAFYPGSVPLRARVTAGDIGSADPQTVEPATVEPGTLAAWATLDDALADHAAAAARNPWLGDYPMLLEATVPVPSTAGDHDRVWQVRDRTGAVVPLGNADEGGWELLDSTGGHTAGLFGTWTGGRLEILSWVPAARLRRRPPPVATPVISPAAAASARGVHAVWPQLTGPALAGTERRPVRDLLARHGQLAAAVSALAPEPALLAAAAAATTARRAGTLAAASGPFPPPAPEDPQPHWGPRGTRRLERILQEEPELVDVLPPEWLSAVAAAGLRAEDGSTRTLLSYGNGDPYVQAKIVPVLGERGRWLAAHHPAGGWVRPWHLDADALEAAWRHDPDLDWDLVLRRLRATDPGRARALLAAAWPSLRREEDRFEYLGSCYADLSPDDEPLLEAALDDRVKRVAARAAELLRRLPGSRLSARMRERARALIRWDSDAAGRLVVRLPAGGQALPDQIERAAAARDGVVPGRREWLRLIVQATPLADWTGLTGRPPGDLVSAAVAAADDGVEQAKYLLDGWCRAARWQPDADWARQLLRLPSEDPGGRTHRWMLTFSSVTGPMAALAAADRTRLLADHLADRGLDAVSVHALQAIPAALTPALGRPVLHALAEAMGRGDWGWAGGARPVDRTGTRVLRRLGARLDPGLLEEARALLTPHATPAGGHDRPVQALWELLGFRREMLAELHAVPATP